MQMLIEDAAIALHGCIVGPLPTAMNDKKEVRKWML